MRKYIAEAIGTFAIVFCGTGAIIIDQETGGMVTHVGIAITFGLVVMAMIYALGDVSGAHFNPAVSVAFAVSGSFSLRELIPYILSQLAGAVLASSVLHLLFPSNEVLGTTIPGGLPIQSFVLEFFLAFFLMLVILPFSQGSKEKGMFAGIAIGSVILLEAMFAGPVSGASMNPARSVAPALLSGHFEHLWVYIFAPILGACSSSLVWTYLKKGS
jgi:aquaporin NIP